MKLVGHLIALVFYSFVLVFCVLIWLALAGLL